MTTPCIPFDGYLNEDGYGRINGEGAHRFVWKTHNGPIPNELHVLHTCDNPACINLEHLFLGTHQDNMADRDRKNRQAKPKGTGNGRAILTEYDALLIKVYLRLGNLSLNDIADMFGVCKSTIVHIKAGRQWSHI